MYTAILLFSVDVLRHRTRQHHGPYCSKIITEVLQQFAIGGPLFASSVACQSTPSLLYMFLKGHSYVSVCMCERARETERERERERDTHTHTHTYMQW